MFAVGTIPYHIIIPTSTAKASAKSTTPDSTVAIGIVRRGK
jgi:hypothetical protein